MSLKEQISHYLCPWMDVTGPESDVVISSRIRLARNLKGLAFPCRAQEGDLLNVYQQVKKILEKEITDEVFHLSLMEDLSPLIRQLLVEKHLISPALALPGPGKALAIHEEQTISMMINEEDHLRLQGLLSGLNLQEAWKQVDGMDDELEKELDYAFHEKWGYLTTCPTNMGTGLRASVMVHLPALELTGRTRSILSTISQLGLAVRGLYGEGTDTSGNLFQISNQITLGQKEDEIIYNLSGVTRQIIDQERNARRYLLQEGYDGIKDRVFRALGLLRYAYRISTQEALRLISDVRLGIHLELIQDVEPSLLSELMVTISPAFLQQKAEKKLTGAEADLRRADLIRRRLETQSSTP